MYTKSVDTAHILVKGLATAYRDWVMDALGAYVKERRKAMGLTQQALADRADIARDTLAQIETGKSKLPVSETRRKLAAALGVRHVDLLVAAGELQPEEVATVAPRWPDDTPERVRLFEAVLRLPPASLRWMAELLELAAQAPQWQPAPQQSPESQPSPPQPASLAERRGRSRDGTPGGS